ncbi:hypothetical protein [Nostoc sp. FACHB-280]|uniref:hypothetical protein n=1 Tax=Nostoc sp. FACHB-280 TaxID=2692839 RepID=UPI00168B8470|nr:hypothetical protein [Nostoc sp. FACHB-280]MBD2495684.1 hypothetical protein [Nostoc sp. FACHB-280]
MEAAKLDAVNDVVDIVGLSKNNKIVLFVKVETLEIEKNLAKEQGLSHLKAYWKIAQKNQVLVINNDLFAMLVDLENIEIFRYSISKNRPLLKRLSSFQTSDILSYYDAEFSNKRIFKLYMETLIEAWLRDLAYHWKYEFPPASKGLADIGLLSQLEGGKTYSQVNIGADTLY